MFGPIFWVGHPALDFQLTDLILLEPQDDGRISLRRREEPVQRLVPEQLILNLLKLQGPFDPVPIESGLVKIEKASNEESVVVDETSDRVCKLRNAAPVLVVVDGAK